MAELPARFTVSGVVREFPSDKGKAVIAGFQDGGTETAERFFRDAFGSVELVDFTDGARITFDSGDVVHLRPSGNAPEFRCYTESGTEERAAANNGIALGIIRFEMA